jgi:ParB-like chromosome segregation protein Spo0J
MTVSHTELKIEHEPIDNVSPHPENANNGDIQALDESIDVTGFYAPIIVQASTGYILAGNHRWEVMKARHEETIPVVYLDVDEIEAKRIMVADNRITRLGQDDPAVLLQLLEEIAATDNGLVGTGFDAAYMQDLIEGMDEKLEFEPEPEAKSATAEDTLYTTYPMMDDMGLCTGVIVEFSDNSYLTATDYNRIRTEIGLKREAESELRAHEVPGWEI